MPPMRTSASAFLFFARGLSVLALLCGAAASVSAQANTAAQTPAVAPTCGMAVAACFEGCAPQMMRTRSGACVPQTLATTARLMGGLEAMTAPRIPLATASQAASASPSCCVMDVTVEADGWKNLGDHAETHGLNWDVRINGQLVGTTPYADALPAGDYNIEVTSTGGASYAATVRLRPGTPAYLLARVELELNAVEKTERDDWRKGREEAKHAAEAEAQHQADIARRLQLAAQEAEAAAQHAAWVTSTAPVRAAQHDHRMWAVITGASGLVLTGVGIGFLVAASSANDDAQAAADDWKLAVTKSAQAAAVIDVRDAEQSRDVDTWIGGPALGLGIAGIGTAIVLLATTPALPPEPGAETPHTANAQRIHVLALGNGLALRVEM
jgi:hypothetical protein